MNSHVGSLLNNINSFFINGVLVYVIEEVGVLIRIHVILCLKEGIKECGAVIFLFGFLYLCTPIIDFM